MMKQELCELFYAYYTVSSAHNPLLKDGKIEFWQQELRKMSSKYTHLVWEEGLEPIDKLILLAFADNAAAGGLAYLSIPELAHFTGLELDQLRVRLKMLEAMGYLLVDPQFSERGVRLRHVYFLNEKKLGEKVV